MIEQTCNYIYQEIDRKRVQSAAIKIERKEFLNLWTGASYWKEQTGVFVLAPRQTGKTSALERTIDKIRDEQKHCDITIVVPRISETKLNGDRILSSSNKHFILDTKKYNVLIVDEFEWIDKKYLDYLLGKYEWQEVIMVGSKK